MRNPNPFRIGIIIAALCAGLAAAEESSVNDIMVDLNRALDASPAVSVEPVNVESADVEPADVEAVNVEAALEESREQYVAGDFEQAAAGFSAILAAEPKNKIAAFYLKQMPSKIHRKAEEAAMAEVDQEWGLILRYYHVTDRFVQSMALEDVEQISDVTEHLAVVEFPEGASALYMPDLQKLFVKNTPANLSRLEEILHAFDQAETKASARQVKIETRFVEFSEGALEELGFSWSNPADGSDLDLPADWSINDGETLFADSLRSVPYGRTGRLGLGEVRDPASSGWNVNRLEDLFSDTAGTLAFSGTIGGDPIDLVIRALDQTSGADVLSAPSLVTLSGETATITVGERHNYPTIYEEGVSAGTVLHVKYEDFEEKILGVEMDVTPTITGDAIDLEINPRITELAGWQQFQLASADTSYTWYQYRVGSQFEHEPVIAKLPVFKRREIKTVISVASGSTIGLGGLISEKTEDFEDRVPVLGTIPLLGRLFRSEGRRAVKRNLMIFVTATKVEPDGRLVSTRNFE